MTDNTHGQVPEALPAIQRFEVVDCIDDKHVPAVIPKPHGPWVRYEDHAAVITAIRAQQPAPATQPSPAAQGDALDAARYRWLREHSLAAGQGSITVELDDRANGNFSRPIFLAELDAAIDAARAAQEGK